MIIKIEQSDAAPDDKFFRHGPHTDGLAIFKTPHGVMSLAQFTQKELDDAVVDKDRVIVTGYGRTRYSLSPGAFIEAHRQIKEAKGWELP